MAYTEPTARDAAEAEQVSRLKRYDKRIEEWLGSLKDEAGQRSPEVLGALAAKAKDVAEYLDKMAEQARSRRAADDAIPTLPTKGASASIESPSEEKRSSTT